ncbi:MAG: translation initiation factor, partial [Verrucomicrobiota bacterium]
MPKKPRIATDGSSGDSLADNPFGELSSEGLKPGKVVTAPKPTHAAPELRKKRGRVDVRREKGGR